ncbi:MAG: phosphoglycerate dehydrogenase [Candidatus Sumerlaeia bacterium]|nr:phosphoglycerate dehydrogenase [Candidatus Sumerlaeia bacterium]
MRVLVADKISDEGLKILANGGKIEVDYRPEITPEEMLTAVVGATGIIVRSRAKVPRAVIEKGVPTLKVVGRAGVGVDNVDVDAASDYGVIVMNTPGGNTISAAEQTMALMLALARNTTRADASMHRGEWEKKLFTGVELNGKTLGIIGLGRIGLEVARRAYAFNMKLLGFDPYVSDEVLAHEKIERATVDRIVMEADFITVHSPLTPETKGLIGAKQFEMMKKTARVINCARGGIIDEAALVEALKSKRIAGAALDVFSVEPLPADHPLRSLDNAILTPHLGASTTEAQENVAIELAQQFVDYLQNGLIRNAVNAPSIDPAILNEMRPYLRLAEQLGKFQSVFPEGRVVKLHILYGGEVLDYPMLALTTAVAKGFLEMRADPPINYVNALRRLKQMGVELTDTRSSKTFSYTNLITVEATTECGRTWTVAGTLFTPELPRIVIVNEKDVDALPSGNMIVIENKDLPGTVGAVTTLIGARNINIAQIAWGRTRPGGDALTVINLDTAAPQTLIEEIRLMPNIISAKGFTI